MDPAFPYQNHNPNSHSHSHHFHPTMPPPPPSQQQHHPQTKTTKPPHRKHNQNHSQTKRQIRQLQASRLTVLSALKTITATHTHLVNSLALIEAENERWQSPNAGLGEMYRLRDEIERAERQGRECHRQWDELGEEIERKHVEIAFGGAGGDGGGD